MGKSITLYIKCHKEIYMLSISVIFNSNIIVVQQQQQNNYIISLKLIIIYYYY